MALRSTYAKQQTNTLCVYIFYFLFMSFTFLALEMTVLKVLRTQEDSIWLCRAVEILFSTSIVLNILVSVSDPGFLKRDEKMDFLTLLETMSPYSLCPECQLIRAPRSRHCFHTQRCVDNYDHYCPWVNNCIGKGNYAQFYLFLVSQLTYLALFGLSAIQLLRLDLSEILMVESLSFQRSFAFVLLIVCLIFLLPLIYLFGSQTKNLLTGMTTSERLNKKSYVEQHRMFQDRQLGRRNRAASAAEQLGSFETYAISDSLGLCCNRTVMSQAEILQRTKEAYGYHDEVPEAQLPQEELQPATKITPLLDKPSQVH